MKRFRIFAGPNGSGKSTIIKSIRQYLKELGKTPGIYVNADDIAVCLADGTFTFTNYEIEQVDNTMLHDFAHRSGLLRGGLTADAFAAAYRLSGSRLTLTGTVSREAIAQVLSNFMIERLMTLGKDCAMETVFSHPGKVEFMRQAAAKGYKVYLYFVATEDPEINKTRVKARVSQGGHDVPEDKIEERYYRALDLLYDGVCTAHDTYFFDNSGSGNNVWHAYCRTGSDGKQTLQNDHAADTPAWFNHYYLSKAATEH